MIGSRLVNKTCDVLRASPGLRNQWGEWQPGGTRLIEGIKISTAPKGTERDVDSDGARVEGDRKIWAYDTESFIAAGAEFDGDLVLYGNQLWRVVRVDDWSSFVEVSLTRLEGQDLMDAQRSFDDLPPAATTGTSAIERLLRRHIATGAGLLTTDANGDVEIQDVIPANSAGPALRSLHATVLIISKVQEGEPALRNQQDDPGDDLITRSARQVLAKVSIQFFRNGAAEVSERFLNWAESPAGKLAEQAADLVLVPPFSETRADTMIGDRLEERIALTFSIRYLSNLEQRPGVIEQVDLNLRHEGGGEDLNIST